MLSPEVRKSIKNLRYLLNQGYPRSSAVEFVSNHYRLELDQRHLLARCVFSKEEATDHQDRGIDVGEVRNRRLGVDGYNVLISVESILGGEQVVKCDDGFIRDLQAIFGKYKMSDVTEKAIDEILNVVDEANPKEVAFFYDKQVSRSGELAGMTRGKLEGRALNGDAKTTVGTDADVRDFEVVASSDRAIIKKSDRVWDVSAEILKHKEANLLDLTKI
ncbi:hypothetical protein AKJ48_01445 [candidate division MSBL1 archaeon SCGC-AAA261O19]|uniref:DUF434 domain-containing protein n=1 Tax=candidate division MSBL1 archaeon SCGC-AAA261O19 TaxID=1698277 RepID=A0A133VEA4_9EURY|nr:hypothetical protein AKJ48_01445 [candidate division MSBL1 archaeon SCGC-AAA261O19]